MKTINVQTGFGYYKDKNGKVIAKARLPKGEHPLADDFEYIEVADEMTLAAIQLPVDPAVEQQRQIDILINQKIRDIAITELKAVGQLPANYKDDKSINNS